jgi:hypothetical protein
VRNVVALCMSLLVFYGLTAQTPAPSSSPAPKPLRHLEYAFSVDEEGQSESHFNGIGNGVETSSGVGSSVSSNGGDGTMYVDILSVTPDGALSVRISEYVRNDARPRAAYTCTVYGNTSVICPSVPAPSQAEWVLLSYLGRQFVEAAPWDSNNHWQRKVANGQYTLVEDFNIVSADGAKPTVIHETKKMDTHDGGFGTSTEHVQITYDRSMEIPDVVHDDMDSVGGSGSGHSVFDFHLTNDSFAAAKPQSP